MGPTNIALVKLSQADKAWRSAVGQLEAASHSVRVQERRLVDLKEKLNLAQTHLREQQAHGGQLDLDIKSRDAKIERYRIQQQNAKNNKEYQAFLTEINTEKLDKAKVEEESLRVMEANEKGQAEIKQLQASIEEETKQHAANKERLGSTLAALQVEIDRLKPVRDQAAAGVPPKAREAFERLADRYEGEAMIPISKPNPRQEEYICSSCNMALVTDIYNRLHSRDELVFCPNCRKILYIPDDLPPEMAIRSVKPDSSTKGGGQPRRRKATTRTAPEASAGGGGGSEVGGGGDIEPRAKGRLGQVLDTAQGESVKGAIDADAPPVECEVWIDGQIVGLYKGKSREHLELSIRFYMDDAGLSGQVAVTERAENTAPTPTSDG